MVNKDEYMFYGLREQQNQRNPRNRLPKERNQQKSIKADPRIQNVKVAVR